MTKTRMKYTPADGHTCGFHIYFHSLPPLFYDFLFLVNYQGWYRVTLQLALVMKS